MSLQDTTAAAAASIAGWLSALYRDLDAMSGEVGLLLESALGERTKISKRDLSGLREKSEHFLNSHSSVVGAGVIFSISSIQDAEGVLEWWVRNDRNGIEKLDFDLAPEGNSFYDYEQLPWFSVAARTGRQTIAGPYVDYLGFNEYIMTCTVPSYVHGSFIGVTGCDLRIRDLEEVFIPMIRAVPGDAAIVNGNENRVVLGNSGRFLVGERIKTEPPGFALVPLEVPYLNLGLLCSSGGPGQES
ncbi:cache domain-containing protein [Arthrobacter mobilis]|uniref:GntR family transcriptional regulator n=1 Tax=Arthrobacter mobilis TaxID=2724944 RepID=A0A7X6HDM1_9MICC|nr:cache domain-containing protein [Arthrobacter mobilis]NKX55189.1 GntR family transcriptional regulator [Arthrobacter mobilis]